MNKKEMFFELSIDLLCTATAEYRYQEVNPTWEKLLGWTPEELRSCNMLEFVHPDDRMSAAEKATSMAGAGDAALEFENRFRHKKGHYVPLAWNATVRDGTFFAIGRDVSERQRQAVALEAALEEVKHFAYAASHDLREPLRTITSHLELVMEKEKEKFSNESKVSIQFVKEAADRMRVMLDGLLEYSRIDASVETAQRVSLAATLERAASYFDDLDIAIESLPMLEVIPTQFERVCQNILANVVRYRHPARSPKVDVSAVVDAGDVTLKFKDNGVGIRKGQEDRALEIFGRCHPRSKFPEGQGVGLAICKRIIERHGGSIRLENNDNGEGLTVVVKLQELSTTPS